MSALKKLGMAMLVALAVAGCKPKEVVTVTNQPMELPCSKFKDDANFYRDFGVGTSINLGSSRLDALENAKQMIRRRLGGKLEGFSRDYSRVVAGQAAAEKVQRHVETAFEQAVDKLLNDAANVCEVTIPLADGQYQTYYAIEISKEELVQKTANILSEEEELEIEFYKDRFFKEWKKWKEENEK